MIEKLNTAPIDLRSWLTQELDEATARLQRQVFELVPRERRRERPGGGSSIAWTTFHLTRHAELALAILTGSAPERLGGDGLGETEEPLLDNLDAALLEDQAIGVLGAARRFVATLTPAELDTVPDAGGALERAGVPRDRYGWLFDQWIGQPAGFFLRWPVIGHTINHTGEMIATRNRMGLNPFSA